VDEPITTAISQYPTPNTRPDLCSFFGLVNQLSSSTDTIATLLAPLQPLLTTKNDFIWSANHDEASQEQKCHSQSHLFCHSSTSMTPPASVLMQVDWELDLSINNNQITSGQLFKQDLGSLPTQNPDMLQLNWKC